MPAAWLFWLRRHRFLLEVTVLVIIQWGVALLHFLAVLVLQTPEIKHLTFLSGITLIGLSGLIILMYSLLIIVFTRLSSRLFRIPSYGPIIVLLLGILSIGLLLLPVYMGRLVADWADAFYIPGHGESGKSDASMEARN